MTIGPTSKLATEGHRARPSHASWWRLDRRDLAWLIALTLIGGILRFGSPIFLDVFAHPGSSAPISSVAITLIRNPRSPS
jgi:hypothetical protein